MVQTFTFPCDIRASFAAVFGEWRRKNKVPLKRIAADLSVSISTVNSWVSGERFPTSQNFAKLVNYTRVPPCRLFCIMAEKCVSPDCLLVRDGESETARPRAVTVTSL